VQAEEDGGRLEGSVLGGAMPLLSAVSQE